VDITDMREPDLAQLTDHPDLTIAIGGREYRFSELPVAQLGRLQAWVKDSSPHPVDEDRRYLLDQARRDAQRWPPKVGTAEGAAALLGTEPGQIEALAAGLSVHHPELSRADAERVFRALRKDAAKEARRAQREGRKYDGEGAARRIFAVLFGLDDDEDDDLKNFGPNGTAAGSIGASSFGVASEN
jgi:hypothetical protein